MSKMPPERLFPLYQILQLLGGNHKLFFKKLHKVTKNYVAGSILVRRKMSYFVPVNTNGLYL